jgi:hypothetical protein
MRCVLLVAVVGMSGGVRAEDEKAKKLKEVEATAKKARKLANEEIEGEEKETAAKLAAVKKADMLTGFSLELGMKRVGLSLPSPAKDGVTNGELMMAVGMVKKVTKESLFYYDDDEFLAAIAEYNPTVTAERFVELARLWAICEGRNLLVECRKRGIELPPDDRPSRLLLKAIRGK